MPNETLERHAGRVSVEGFLMEAARATADFYIEHAAAADGVPYWDTGRARSHAAGRLDEP